MLTAKDIRQLRLALGWKQVEMAFRVGVSENTVKRWEAGDRHPRFKHLEKLNGFLKKAQAEKGLVLAS